MRYYKLKVKHKRIDDLEAWFYIMDDPWEEVAMLTQSCLRRNLSYYPLPETLIEITEQEYFLFFKNHIYYNE